MRAGSAFGALAPALAREDFEVTEAGLMAALEQDQFDVVFQPKVACATGELVGFEALARWHHPRAGTIMPDRFIATAEQFGLIDGLTERIIDKGLEWMTREFASSALTLAFNVTAISLRDQELADRLSAACVKHGIDPSRLVLEITETSAMSDQVATLDLLTRLRLNGFHLSIDDFGVGYSSLVRKFARCIAWRGAIKKVRESSWGTVRAITPFIENDHGCAGMRGKAFQCSLERCARTGSFTCSCNLLAPGAADATSSDSPR